MSDGQPKNLNAGPCEPVDLSVVIPVYNEEENVPVIFSKLQAVLGSTGKTFEIIFVDDGSTDASLRRMLDIKKQAPEVRVFGLGRNMGKSIALATGFKHALGENVVTLDADYQEPPEAIPSLIACLDNGYDMVSAWRKRRRDPLEKVWSSKIFNWLVHKIARTSIHDINCGFKIYKKEVVKNIQLHGGLHRVIPILAERAGYRVGEMVVEHRPREHGETKFRGVFRGLHGIFDLLTVLFLASYHKRPMHFFGMVGLILFLFGLAINAFLTFRYFLGIGFIGERLPLLMLGILSMILGFQSFCIGLLGEMFVRGTSEAAPKGQDEEIHS
ncbi:MAG: glycosyltransferase family 2 protein [Nitrospinales bacterium]